MSDLSQLLHKKLSPVAFIKKQIAALKNLVGNDPVDGAIDEATQELIKLKQVVSIAVSDYLKDKLPNGVEDVADTVAQAALNAIEATLKGALINLKQ